MYTQMALIMSNKAAHDTFNVFYYFSTTVFSKATLRKQNLWFCLLYIGLSIHDDENRCLYVR